MSDSMFVILIGLLVANLVGLVVTLLLVARRRTAPAPAESGVDLDTALRGLSEALAEDRGAVTEKHGHVDRHLSELQLPCAQPDRAGTGQIGQHGPQSVV